MRKSQPRVVDREASHLKPSRASVDYLRAMRNLSNRLVFLSMLLVADAKSGEIDLPRLAEIKLAAARGDPKAQYELGASSNSRHDHANAVRWYRRSAQQGSANAQCSLAQTLLRGYPKMSGSAAIKAEPEEAVQWFLKAANRGHELAQIDLGRCYQGGNGVPQRCAGLHVVFHRGAAE